LSAGAAWHDPSSKQIMGQFVTLQLSGSISIKAEVQFVPSRPCRRMAACAQEWCTVWQPESAQTSLCVSWLACQRLYKRTASSPDRHTFAVHMCWSPDLAISIMSKYRLYGFAILCRRGRHRANKSGGKAVCIAAADDRRRWIHRGVDLTHTSVTHARPTPVAAVWSSAASWSTFEKDAPH
jgi:hypothetical protein